VTQWPQSGKWLAHGHATCKWQNRDSNSGTSDCKIVLQIAQLKAAFQDDQGSSLQAGKLSLKTWVRRIWPKPYWFLSRKRPSKSTKQVDFRVMRARAWHGSQTSKEISEERKEPRLAGGCGLQAELPRLEAVRAVQGPHVLWTSIPESMAWNGESNYRRIKWVQITWDTFTIVANT
jgi:hypothetical protein